jgi:hypothetical protein
VQIALDVAVSGIHTRQGGGVGAWGVTSDINISSNVPLISSKEISSNEFTY